jgi:hypothetical protein
LDFGEVMRIVGKHKLGTYAFSFAKDSLPKELGRAMGTIHVVSLQKFLKAQELAFQLDHLADQAGLALPQSGGSD